MSVDWLPLALFAMVVVALLAGFQADRHGNIYTGPSTEDTPALVEPTAFSDGIVIFQVNEIVGELPRVDIPASWVDSVVVADKPFYIEPLFTRDPRHIKPVHVLMAMMAILMAVAMLMMAHFDFLSRIALSHTRSATLDVAPRRCPSRSW